MNTVDLRISDATRLLTAGAPRDARNIVLQLLKTDAQNDALWYHLGLSEQALGRTESAIQSYERALSINPALAFAWNNIGVCLERQGDLLQAEHAFRQAVEVDANLAPAQFNRGRIAYQRGAFSEALAALEKACALRPADVDSWLLLHDAINATQQLERLVPAYQRIAQHAPDVLAHLPVAFAAARRSPAVDEALALERLRTLLQSPPVATSAAHKPLEATLSELTVIAQYLDLSLDEQQRLYTMLNQLTKDAGKAVPVHRTSRTRGERVRLGYLSPDFRVHVMGRVWLPVVAAHDRQRFDVTLFSTSPVGIEDDFTRRFRAASDRFVSIEGMSDEQAARLVAEHDLDILVDLASHTAGGRPFVLAKKPARVVITHLGYHGCVGLDAVDFKITDLHCDTVESVRYQIEAPLVLDTCVLPLRRPANGRKALPERKAALDLAGKFVFGAFVNVVKLSPELLDTWKVILDQLPHAVIAFSPFLACDRTALTERCAAAGIAPARIAFIPADVSGADLGARYAAIDAVLDTFPYSGGDTTIAALEHGVPVVTLRGDRHARRVGASILAHIDVDETVADSISQYVEIAVRLSKDADWLAALSTKIVASLSTSPHANATHYARCLEAAYIRALTAKGVDFSSGGRLSAAEFHGELQTAVRDHREGRIPEAERSYLRLLDDQPRYAPLTYLYGMLLRARGDGGSASELLERTLAVDPQHVDALVALGNLAFEERRYDEAATRFESATAIAPTRAEAWNGLGSALAKQGNRERARACFERAVQAAPEDALGYYNLATIQQGLGLTAKARANFRQVIALKPDYTEAIYNYGVLLRELGQDELAIKCLQRVIAIDPRFEEAYWQLRPTLLAAGRIHEWLANLDAYERNFPKSARHALYLIESDFYLGKPDAVRQHLDQAIAEALKVDDEEQAIELLEELLYVALFFDIAPSDVLSLYRRYDEMTKRSFPRLPPPQPRDPRRRVKIAYLSGDVRAHVMGKMLHEIVKRHDQKRFEVTLYALGLKEDSFTNELAQRCEHFVRLGGMSAEDAAMRIRADDIDVLIDCSTHTRGSEPGIVIKRPARCQITHVASSGALGSSSIDFKLTDQYSDIPENQQYLIERLLPMNGCVYPYRHVEAAAVPHYRRSVLGLADETILFGAFVQILKLSPRLLQVWKRVLARLPHAKLAFSPGQFSQRQGYINWCKAAGIHESQITFIDPGRNDAENMARYGLIDLVMDTFPYGGVNGTLEALDAGVPVVALAGKRNQERTSLSILSNLDVPELIVHSEREYIDMACKLALDRQLRKQLRDKIKAKLSQSVLTDMDVHVRHLEAAYMTALEQTEQRHTQR